MQGYCFSIYYIIKQKRPKITKLFNLIEKTRTKLFCFGLDANIAMLFRAEQPIKMHKKYCSSLHKYNANTDYNYGIILLR